MGTALESPCQTRFDVIRKNPNNPDCLVKNLMASFQDEIETKEDFQLCTACDDDDDDDLYPVNKTLIEEEDLTKFRVSIASRLEKLRLKRLRELETANRWLKSLSKRDFSISENNIANLIKQIRPKRDNVTAKTNEILKIFKASCHVSISIQAFAKEIVSASGNPFALTYVILHVTSKYPQVMDILLAEIHKACIYTTHNTTLNYSSSHNDYNRIDSVMRLYGALVQTDIQGNTHGIEHGWAWLARFLKQTTAPNRATATALNAFLQTAGYGLHQRYKSQFLKAVNLVKKHFLPKLKAAKEDSSHLQFIIADITAYIDDRMYLNEPQVRRLCRPIFCRGNNFKHHYR